MSNHLAETVRKLVGLLIILITFGGAFLYYIWNELSDVRMNIDEARVKVIVTPGSSLTSVANQLNEEGILRKPEAFIIYARLRGDDDKIKSGSYWLEKTITPVKFLEKIVKGDVIEHSHTIIEGTTYLQVVKALEINSHLVHVSEGLADQRVRENLNVSEEFSRMEGLLLPDTYLFNEGMTDLDIIERAHISLKDFLQKAWMNRAENLPLSSPYEALILASIIEKETALASERETIAGVLIRRLQKNMRLQVDPTVIYGMGAAFKGDIRRRDLKKHTPYNTYLNKGLPPTPIAMASRASIIAALHPQPGESLYFVATGDGGHYFSATLAEHRQAVVKYQLNRKKNK